jgi:Cof subfamily protein (haloacid dehalogenase superfamily)
MRLIQLMEAQQERIIDRYQGERVYKISFFCTREEQMDEVERRIAHLGKLVRFGNLLTESRVCVGEITGPGTDKGRSLREICQHFGADVSRSIAFGDSMNDAEMLTAAGIGVAMGNAEEKVKALADRVCESCAEDGIARELERLGLC